MPSKRVIQFYDLDSFAVIGVSRTRKNMAWAFYEQLLKLGKRVYGIGIQDVVKDGAKCYTSLKSLPEIPEGIIVCVNPASTKGLLDELKNSGAKYIWFQQGSYNNEVLRFSAELGLDPVKGCAFMYMPGVSAFHRFHRTVNEFFGKGYK